MGSASYTKGAKRVGGNHEWTRMARRGNSEPRMDTNGHEWEIQNHEWTRMDTKGKFRTTNGHEWTRKGNSEPRMDTNRWEEPRMDTNGHEWNHEIQEWNHETHEKHEKRQGG